MWQQEAANFTELQYPFVIIGMCRAIGVSNFLVHHLEQLKEDCCVMPHVNQVVV